MSSLPKMCHFSTKEGPHCKKETVIIVSSSSTVRQIRCVFKIQLKSSLSQTAEDSEGLSRKWMMRRSGLRQDKWSWVKWIISQRRLNFDDSLRKPKHCCNLYSIWGLQNQDKSLVGVGDGHFFGGWGYVKVEREGDYGGVRRVQRVWWGCICSQSQSAASKAPFPNNGPHQCAGSGVTGVSAPNKCAISAHMTILTQLL